MVSRNALRWTLAALTLLGARSVSAGPISFTGHVEQDFDQSDKSVQVIQVNSDPFNRIVQMPEMTAQGIINGYALKDMRMSYDSKSDTLFVGLNTYSVAGSAIGNGGSDIANLFASRGGQDPAHLGGNKSITVGFAGRNLNDTGAPGSAIMVAGVPANKALAGPGIDGFTVNRFQGTLTSPIQSSYGAALTNHQGALAFDPSAEHPGFEFTIKNFSQISPDLLNPKEGFWVKAYLGSPDDIPIGEEGTGWIKLPAFAPEVIPEPTTWLAWSLMTVSAGALQLRRRSRSRED